jgi:hypothetical protein
MHGHRRRYRLIFATAFWFSALGLLLFGLSGLATETKVGGAHQNSKGGWTFEPTTFGDNKKSANGKRTPKPTPSPSPKKKSCDKEQGEVNDKCGKLAKMKKDWELKCRDNYVQNRGECEAMGPGISEMETACKQAQYDLAKCQGKQPASQPKPSPSQPPCDQLQTYADEACGFAHEVECGCSGDQYSENYDWCEAVAKGQSVKARIDSLRDSCQEASKKLKERCPGKSSYWSSAPCGPVHKPSRHQLHCWDLVDQLRMCDWTTERAKCDALEKQYHRECE